LEKSLKWRDFCSLHPDEVQSNFASGASTSPHTGRWAAFDALGLDNVKLHADATYSDTLAQSPTSSGQGLTAFQLTSVKFIPTLSVTYELNLGQLTKARRQWKTEQEVGLARKNRYETDRQKLLEAYAQFETARDVFLEAQDSSAAARTAFYKLREQAIVVLSLAHYYPAGTDTSNTVPKTLDSWLQAEYTQLQQTGRALAQATTPGR